MPWLDILVPQCSHIHVMIPSVTSGTGNAALLGALLGKIPASNPWDILLALILTQLNILAPCSVYKRLFKM